jgi:carbamoyl-phosphate synthase large subunit
MKLRDAENGEPTIIDAMKNGDIQLVINTPKGKSSQVDDSYIRKNAIRLQIPYMTTIAAAVAAAKGIEAILSSKDTVKSLQEYHD